MSNSYKPRIGDRVRILKCCMGDKLHEGKVGIVVEFSGRYINVDWNGEPLDNCSAIEVSSVKSPKRSKYSSVAEPKYSPKVKKCPHPKEARHIEGRVDILSGKIMFLITYCADCGAKLREVEVK